MNKSVEHYISNLLFLHDCVIIPKFGGFVANQRSAQLNKTTHSLSPFKTDSVQHESKNK